MHVRSTSLNACAIYIAKCACASTSLNACVHLHHYMRACIYISPHPQTAMTGNTAANRETYTHTETARASDRKREMGERPRERERASEQERGRERAGEYHTSRDHEDRGEKQEPCFEAAPPLAFHTIPSLVNTCKCFMCMFEWACGSEACVPWPGRAAAEAALPRATRSRPNLGRTFIFSQNSDLRPPQADMNDISNPKKSHFLDMSVASGVLLDLRLRPKKMKN